MIVRTARCSCGQLTATCTGEPVRVSICHCQACQRRTGSAFGAQARFLVADVAFAGTASEYVRTGESGTRAVFSFCPTCASIVYWKVEGDTEQVAIAIGAFAGEPFPAPRISMYGEQGHAWVRLPDDIEHG